MLVMHNPKVSSNLKHNLHNKLYTLERAGFENLITQTNIFILIERPNTCQQINTSPFV